MQNTFPIQSRTYTKKRTVIQPIIVRQQFIIKKPITVRQTATSQSRRQVHSQTEGQRFAKSRSADADCIPSPKRKVCGSQNSNRKQCRPHTHSQTAGQRCAKSRSADADCIPTPKRKVCGSQRQTAYPLQNGRFAVHKIALGGCRPHTHSETEGLRCAKSRSADAA